MTYSIDTSAILDGYKRYYPPEVFPKLWDNLESIIRAGKLKAIELVCREIERKDDTLDLFRN